MISLNFSLFSKINSPIPSSPILLVLNVLLELLMHFLDFLFVPLTLLMHNVKLLISELHLFLELFNDSINFFELIFPEGACSLNLINLKCKIIDQTL